MAGAEQSEQLVLGEEFERFYVRELREHANLCPLEAMAIFVAGAEAILTILAKQPSEAHDLMQEVKAFNHIFYSEIRGRKSQTGQR
jgi:hypothetical protein